MTTVADTTVTPSLSAAMREGSRAEHEAAENSTFMSELLEGKLNADAYAALLLRLHRVYGALEPVTRAQADDPLVAAVHDAALERATAIEADLAHWAPGVDPASVDSPAAAAYADRLREAAAWGGRVVAHHYTRYLGDLSGGQVIGRILTRTFDLPEGLGVEFYEFPAIPKPKPYKDAYRARLDALSLDAEQIDAVVAEVKVAFNLNQALFAELSADIEQYRRGDA